MFVPTIKAHARPVSIMLLCFLAFFNFSVAY